MNTRRIMNPPRHRARHIQFNTVKHHPLAIALSHAILNDVADYRLQKELDAQNPARVMQEIAREAGFKTVDETFDQAAAALAEPGKAATIDAGGA